MQRYDVGEKEIVSGDISLLRCSRKTHLSDNIYVVKMVRKKKKKRKWCRQHQTKRI